jgi:hypothetical protein
MPYQKDRNTIATKVIGVTASDEENGVQQVLYDLMLNPEWAKIFYTKGLEIWVLTEDNRNFRLGTVKEKYRDLLDNNYSVIRKWKITGGHPLGEKYNGVCTPLGLNIEIKLQDKPKDPIP